MPAESYTMPYRTGRYGQKVHIAAAAAEGKEYGIC